MGINTITKQNKIMKTYVYARVSTEQQDFE